MKDNEIQDESPFVNGDENETVGLTIVEEIPAIDPAIIDTALEKENITEKVIAKLKEDYMGLKINGVEDKDGYEKVKLARKICKQTRIIAENICKKGRERATLEQKAWVSKQKEIGDEIKEVETYLSEQEDAFEEDKKRVKFEIAQFEKLPARVAKLLNVEGLFTPEQVKELEPSILKWDDLAFDSFFNEAFKKHLKVQQDKIAADQLKVANDQKEQAETLRKEREAIQNERLTSRSTNLASLGMIWNGSSFTLEDLRVSKEDIQNKNGEEWDGFFEGLKPNITAALAVKKKKEDDATEKIRKEEKGKTDALLVAQVIKGRIAQLIAIGMKENMVDRKFTFPKDANPDYISIPFDQVIKSSVQEFDTLFADTKFKVEAVKVEKAKAEEAARALALIVDGRKKQLLAIGIKAIHARDGIYGYAYEKDVNTILLKEEQVTELTTEEWDWLFADLKLKVEKAKSDIVAAKVKKAADEKAEAERLEKEEEDRQAALLPDLTKVQNFAKELIAFVKEKQPQIKDAELKMTLTAGCQLITTTAQGLVDALEGKKKKSKKK